MSVWRDPKWGNSPKIITISLIEELNFMQVVAGVKEGSQFFLYAWICFMFVGCEVIVENSSC